jgi:hypothetical protein
MKPALLLAGLIACATTAGSMPGPPWAHAVAVADCAPWDGAATSIHLTDAPVGASETYPSLRITIYHDLLSVDGSKWEIGTSVPDGAQSVLCEQQGDCAVAATGWVDFERRRRNEPLRGQYQVRFADGRRLSGSFTATIKATRVMCG